MSRRTLGCVRKVLSSHRAALKKLAALHLPGEGSDDR
jgi:hypothetical protein